MFMFCVKEAEWGMMALGAPFAPWFSECAMHSATCKQHSCPSKTRRWFHQFLVIYRCLDKGGEGQRKLRRPREWSGCLWRQIPLQALIKHE